MDSQESEVKCRICLENKVEVYWNDLLFDHSHLTFKDCYYKYTQLEYIDSDNFSSWLCRNCSNGLEYIDAFISKAIETHLILQKEFNLNTIIEDDETSIKYEAPNFEEILIENTEIKHEMPDLEIQNIYECYSEDLPNVPADESGMILKETRKLEPRKIPLTDKKPSVKIEEKICCSICSKVLASRYKAIQHEKTHIQNRERNMPCSKCGLKFYCKYILRKHMKTHMENREKTHKCEFCAKTFYYKYGLNKHRRKHLGQMIPCSLCPKTFYHQKELDTHMSSHSAARITSDIKIKEKSFIPCKDCGENIRTINFKSHMARHTNEPLCKCSICNKEFFSRKSCDKHLKKTHKKQSTERKNFIITYKSNRISRLFLEQYTSKDV